MPETPRCVVFHRYGEETELVVERAPERSPGPEEIAIDVAFSGVNFADLLARRGFYKWASAPPTCVGFEVSGVVREVGRDVMAWKAGDRVMAVTRFGGYADRVTIEAERAFRVPEKMSLEEAAAISAVSLTAWHALYEVARVREGESILIQAVAGGVGLAALQMAKAKGMMTFGTASRADKLAKAVAFGLDHAIDYTRDDFERVIAEKTNGRGVNVVLDSLGGEGLRKGYRCLSRGGLVVTIGAAQVAPESRSIVGLAKAAVELVRGGLFHPFSLVEDNRGIAGVQILLYWDDLGHLKKGMNEVLALWGDGVIRPLIDSVVPLERAAEAHARMGSRKSAGKILLRCAGAET